MKKDVFFILFFVIVIFIGFVRADVISLNSEGDISLIIKPDNYLESSFSGEPIVLFVEGNGILEEPYEECDDRTYESVDGCSATRENEQEPEESYLVGLGNPYIQLESNEIKISMLINTNLEEVVGIINLNRTSSINFSVFVWGFDPDLIVNFWDERNNQWTDSFNLYLFPGEIYELRIRFSAPNSTGRYNGTLVIGSKKVGVSLNIQKKLLLFDSNIIVLNKDYLSPQGEKLKTSVTLIPVGDKERMDVTLNYTIRDYNGKVYLTRSETVFLDNQINFKRNFDTGALPLGSYIISLELIYPNGIAPSSAHFEVVGGRQSTFFGKLVFFLVNFILITLILIMALIIWRAIKRIKDKNKVQEKELKDLKEDKEKKKENKEEKSEKKRKVKK